MFNKKKPFRSKKYLQWVREQSCCITGSSNVVAHHVINCDMGGSMGSKQSDLFTIPLDHLLHQQLHTNPKEFEREHDQKRLALETIEKAVNSGLLSVA